MGKFKELFRDYGFQVQMLPNDGFIAYNNEYIVAVSKRYNAEDGDHAICAAAFPIDCIVPLMCGYICELVENSYKSIGWFAYEHYDGYASEHVGLCNHDHSFGEVHMWLKRVTGKE